MDKSMDDTRPQPPSSPKEKANDLPSLDLLQRSHPPAQPPASTSSPTQAQQHALPPPPPPQQQQQPPNQCYEAKLALTFSLPAPQHQSSSDAPAAPAEGQVRGSELAPRRVSPNTNGSRQGQGWASGAWSVLGRAVRGVLRSPLLLTLAAHIALSRLLATPAQAPTPALAPPPAPAAPVPSPLPPSPSPCPSMGSSGMEEPVSAARHFFGCHSRGYHHHPAPTRFDGMER